MSEDILYDMQDHLKNLDSFFKTQVGVFDSATQFVESLKNDLDYISHDQEAEHALNQMRLITHIIDGKQFDYSRVPELNSLRSIVETAHDAMLEQKREELLEVVRSCLEAIHEHFEFNDETRNISHKADNFYSQKKEQIAAEKSLALLDGLSVPMWSYKDTATLQIEAAMRHKSVLQLQSVSNEGDRKPQPKKIVKKVARQQMFPARTLSTEAEIDAYVENIRKQMKQYLRGSDGIQIN